MGYDNYLFLCVKHVGVVSNECSVTMRREMGYHKYLFREWLATDV